jgi:hypothetical protein
MRFPIRAALTAAPALLLCTMGVGPVRAAQTVSDVPASHWARPAVLETVKRGILAAPGGKFRGDAKITRTELANALAAFGKSLEKGAWRGTNPKPLKDPGDGAFAEGQPVTRYEVAAVLLRSGQYAQKGLPKPGPKRFGESEAFPPTPSIAAVPKGHAARAALEYLHKNRMLAPKSPLVSPSSKAVTADELAQAVAMVIVGLTDQFTDEPQNREEIPHPPARTP